MVNIVGTIELGSSLGTTGVISGLFGGGGIGKYNPSENCRQNTFWGATLNHSALSKFYLLFEYRPINKNLSTWSHIFSFGKHALNNRDSDTPELPIAINYTRSGIPGLALSTVVLKDYNVDEYNFYGIYVDKNKSQVSYYINSKLVHTINNTTVNNSSFYLGGSGGRKTNSGRFKSFVVYDGFMLMGSQPTLLENKNKVYFYNE